MTESTVKYKDGEDGPERVLRGEIIERTDEHIIMQRRDGTFTIRRKWIVWVKDPPEGDENRG